jgi:hypothetical protein
VTLRKSRNWMLPALAVLLAGVVAWVWIDGGERELSVIEAPVSLPGGVR